MHVVSRDRGGYDPITGSVSLPIGEVDPDAAVGPDVQQAEAHRRGLILVPALLYENVHKKQFFSVVVASRWGLGADPVYALGQVERLGDPRRLLSIAVPIPRQVNRRVLERAGLDAAVLALEPGVPLPGWHSLLRSADSAAVYELWRYARAVTDGMGPEPSADEKLMALQRVAERFATSTGTTPIVVLAVAEAQDDRGRFDYVDWAALVDVRRSWAELLVVLVHELAHAEPYYRLAAGDDRQPLSRDVLLDRLRSIATKRSWDGLSDHRALWEDLFGSGASASAAARVELDRAAAALDAVAPADTAALAEATATYRSALARFAWSPLEGSPHAIERDWRGWRRVVPTRRPGTAEGSVFDVHIDGRIIRDDGVVIRADGWRRIADGLLHPASRSRLTSDGRLEVVDESAAASLLFGMPLQWHTLEVASHGVMVEDTRITLAFSWPPPVGIADLPEAIAPPTGAAERAGDDVLRGEEAGTTVVLDADARRSPVLADGDVIRGYHLYAGSLIAELSHDDPGERLVALQRLAAFLTDAAGLPKVTVAIAALAEGRSATLDDRISVVSISDVIVDPAALASELLVQLIGVEAAGVATARRRAELTAQARQAVADLGPLMSPARSGLVDALKLSKPDVLQRYHELARSLPVTLTDQERAAAVDSLVRLLVDEAGLVAPALIPEWTAGTMPPNRATRTLRYPIDINSGQLANFVLAWMNQAEAWAALGDIVRQRADETRQPRSVSRFADRALPTTQGRLPVGDPRRPLAWALFDETFLGGYERIWQAKTNLAPLKREAEVRADPSMAYLDRLDGGTAHPLVDAIRGDAFVAEAAYRASMTVAAKEAYLRPWQLLGDVPDWREVVASPPPAPDGYQLVPTPSGLHLYPDGVTPSEVNRQPYVRLRLTVDGLEADLAQAAALLDSLPGGHADTAIIDWRPLRPLTPATGHAAAQRLGGRRVLAIPTEMLKPPPGIGPRAAAMDARLDFTMRSLAREYHLFPADARYALPFPLNKPAPQSEEVNIGLGWVARGLFVGPGLLPNGFQQPETLDENGRPRVVVEGVPGAPIPPAVLAAAAALARYHAIELNVRGDVAGPLRLPSVDTAAVRSRLADLYGPYAIVFGLEMALRHTDPNTNDEWSQFTPLQLMDAVFRLAAGAEVVTSASKMAELVARLAHDIGIPEGEAAPGPRLLAAAYVVARADGLPGLTTARLRLGDGPLMRAHAEVRRRLLTGQDPVPLRAAAFGRVADRYPTMVTVKLTFPIDRRGEAATARAFGAGIDLSYGDTASDDSTRREAVLAFAVVGTDGFWQLLDEALGVVRAMDAHVVGGVIRVGTAVFREDVPAYLHVLELFYGHQGVLSRIWQDPLADSPTAVVGHTRADGTPAAVVHAFGAGDPGPLAIQMNYTADDHVAFTVGGLGLFAGVLRTQVGMAQGLVAAAHGRASARMPLQGWRAEPVGGHGTPGAVARSSAGFRLGEPPRAEEALTARRLIEVLPEEDVGSVAALFHLGAWPTTSVQHHADEGEPSPGVGLDEVLVLTSVPVDDLLEPFQGLAHLRNEVLYAPSTVALPALPDDVREAAGRAFPGQDPWVTVVRSLDRDAVLKGVVAQHPVMAGADAYWRLMRGVLVVPADLLADAVRSLGELVVALGPDPSNTRLGEVFQPAPGWDELGTDDRALVEIVPDVVVVPDLSWLDVALPGAESVEEILATAPATLSDVPRWMREERIAKGKLPVPLLEHDIGAARLPLGSEIEFELAVNDPANAWTYVPVRVRRKLIGRVLFALGLTRTPVQQPFRSKRGNPTTAVDGWYYEDEPSCPDGGEIISPIHWLATRFTRAEAKVVEILKQFGAVAGEQGYDIHRGVGVLGEIVRQVGPVPSESLRAFRRRVDALAGRAGRRMPAEADVAYLVKSSQITDYFVEIILRLSTNPAADEQSGTYWCNPFWSPAVGYRSGVEAVIEGRSGEFRGLLSYLQVTYRPDGHDEVRGQDATLEPAFMQTMKKAHAGSAVASLRDDLPVFGPSPPAAPLGRFHDPLRPLPPRTGGWRVFDLESRVEADLLALFLHVAFPQRGGGRERVDMLQAAALYFLNPPIAGDLADMSVPGPWAYRHRVARVDAGPRPPAELGALVADAARWLGLSYPREVVLRLSSVSQLVDRFRGDAAAWTAAQIYPLALLGSQHPDSILSDEAMGELYAAVGALLVRVPAAERPRWVFDRVSARREEWNSFKDAHTPVSEWLTEAAQALVAPATRPVAGGHWLIDSSASDGDPPLGADRWPYLEDMVTVGGLLRPDGTLSGWTPRRLATWLTATYPAHWPGFRGVLLPVVGAFGSQLRAELRAVGREVGVLEAAPALAAGEMVVPAAVEGGRWVWYPPGAGRSRPLAAGLGEMGRLVGHRVVAWAQPDPLADGAPVPWPAGGTLPPEVMQRLRDYPFETLAEGGATASYGELRRRGVDRLEVAPLHELLTTPQILTPIEGRRRAYLLDANHGASAHIVEIFPAGPVIHPADTELTEETRAELENRPRNGTAVLHRHPRSDDRQVNRLRDALMPEIRDGLRDSTPVEQFALFELPHLRRSALAMQVPLDRASSDEGDAAEAAARLRQAQQRLIDAQRRLEESMAAMAGQPHAQAVMAGGVDPAQALRAHGERVEQAVREALDLPVPGAVLARIERMRVELAELDQRMAAHIGRSRSVPPAAVDLPQADDPRVVEGLLETAQSWMDRSTADEALSDRGPRNLMSAYMIDYYLTDTLQTGKWLADELDQHPTNTPPASPPTVEELHIFAAEGGGSGEAYLTVSEPMESYGLEAGHSAVGLYSSEGAARRAGAAHMYRLRVPPGRMVLVTQADGIDGRDVQAARGAGQDLLLPHSGLSGVRVDKVYGDWAAFLRDHVLLGKDLADLHRPLPGEVDVTTIGRGFGLHSGPALAWLVWRVAQEPDAGLSDRSLKQLVDDVTDRLGLPRLRRVELIVDSGLGDRAKFNWRTLTLTVFGPRLTVPALVDGVRQVEQLFSIARLVVVWGGADAVRRYVTDPDWIEKAQENPLLPGAPGYGAALGWWRSWFEPGPQGWDPVDATGLTARELYANALEEYANAYAQPASPLDLAARKRELSAARAVHAHRDLAYRNDPLVADVLGVQDLLLVDGWTPELAKAVDVSRLLNLPPYGHVAEATRAGAHVSPVGVDTKASLPTARTATPQLEWARLSFDHAVTSLDAVEHAVAMTGKAMVDIASAGGLAGWVSQIVNLDGAATLTPEQVGEIAERIQGGRGGGPVVVAARLLSARPSASAWVWAIGRDGYQVTNDEQVAEFFFFPKSLPAPSYLTARPVPSSGDDPERGRIDLRTVGRGFGLHTNQALQWLTGRLEQEPNDDLTEERLRILVDDVTRYLKVPPVSGVKLVLDDTIALDTSFSSKLIFTVYRRRLSKGSWAHELRHVEQVMYIARLLAAWGGAAAVRPFVENAAWAKQALDNPLFPDAPEYPAVVRWWRDTARAGRPYRGTTHGAREARARLSGAVSNYVQAYNAGSSLAELAEPRQELWIARADEAQEYAGYQRNAMEADAFGAEDLLHENGGAPELLKPRDVTKALTRPPDGHELDRTPAGLHLSPRGSDARASLAAARAVTPQMDWSRLSFDPAVTSLEAVEHTLAVTPRAMVDLGSVGGLAGWVSQIVHLSDAARLTPAQVEQVSEWLQGRLGGGPVAVPVGVLSARPLASRWVWSLGHDGRKVTDEGQASEYLFFPRSLPAPRQVTPHPVLGQGDGARVDVPHGRAELEVVPARSTSVPVMAVSVRKAEDRLLAKLVTLGTKIIEDLAAQSIHPDLGVFVLEAPRVGDHLEGLFDPHRSDESITVSIEELGLWLPGLGWQEGQAVILLVDEAAARHPGQATNMGRTAVTALHVPVAALRARLARPSRGVALPPAADYRWLPPGLRDGRFSSRVTLAIDTTTRTTGRLLGHLHGAPSGLVLVAAARYLQLHAGGVLDAAAESPNAYYVIAAPAADGDGVRLPIDGADDRVSTSSELAGALSDPGSKRPPGRDLILVTDGPDPFTEAFVNNLHAELQAAGEPSVHVRQMTVATLKGHHGPDAAAPTSRLGPPMDPRAGAGSSGELRTQERPAGDGARAAPPTRDSAPTGQADFEAAPATLLDRVRELNNQLGTNYPVDDPAAMEDIVLRVEAELRGSGVAVQLSPDEVLRSGQIGSGLLVGPTQSRPGVRGVTMPGGLVVHPGSDLVLATLTDDAVGRVLGPPSVAVSGGRGLVGVLARSPGSVRGWLARATFGGYDPHIDWATPIDRFEFELPSQVKWTDVRQVLVHWGAVSDGPLEHVVTGHQAFAMMRHLTFQGRELRLDYEVVIGGELGIPGEAARREATRAQELYGLELVEGRLRVVDQELAGWLDRLATGLSVPLFATREQLLELVRETGVATLRRLWQVARLSRGHLETLLGLDGRDALRKSVVSSMPWQAALDDPGRVASSAPPGFEVTGLAGALVLRPAGLAVPDPAYRTLPTDGVLKVFVFAGSNRPILDLAGALVHVLEGVFGDDAPLHLQLYVWWGSDHPCDVVPDQPPWLSRRPLLDLVADKTMRFYSELELQTLVGTVADRLVVGSVTAAPTGPWVHSAGTVKQLPAQSIVSSFATRRSAKSIPASWDMRSRMVGFKGTDGGVSGLTTQMLKPWFEHNNVPDNTLPLLDGLRAVLWSDTDTDTGSGLRADGGFEKTFGLNEAEEFLDWVRDRVGPWWQAQQVKLAQTVDQVVDWIEERFPAERVIYVGIGRSPTPVQVLVQGRGHDALNLPLSEFRPGPADPSSILAPVLRSRRPLPERGRLDMLWDHFDEFLGALPSGKDIVIVDRVDSGATLIAAQHYVREYLKVRGRGGIEVDAVALVTPRSLQRIDAYHRTIVDARQDDDAGRQAEREEWGKHFHILRFGGDGPVADPDSLFGDLLDRDGFDDFAEYGRFRVLTQAPETFEQDRPRWYSSMDLVDRLRGLNQSFKATYPVDDPAEVDRIVTATAALLHDEGVAVQISMTAVRAGDQLAGVADGAPPYDDAGPPPPYRILAEALQPPPEKQSGVSVSGVRAVGRPADSEAPVSELVSVYLRSSVLPRLLGPRGLPSGGRGSRGALIAILAGAPEAVVRDRVARATAFGYDRPPPADRPAPDLDVLAPAGPSVDRRGERRRALGDLGQRYPAAYGDAKPGAGVGRASHRRTRPRRQHPGLGHAHRGVPRPGDQRPG